MMRRSRDAEADLNLPPGFRFHPTDDELVVHYLCRKATQQLLPVPIIAEVDLYKFDPWQLPDMALFGHKEWYFFTPRDRKYPNGSRPNRAAGSGYWKATGADKPVTPEGSGKPLGIKKALVFYAGKAPRGVKTNWIMHEYRLADSKKSTTHHKKGSLRLDDWVLCRLYNKKNNWEKERQQYQIQNQIQQQQRAHKSEQTEDVDEAASDSHRTAESDIDNDDFMTAGGGGGLQMGWDRIIKEDSEWFTELNLDDLQNTFATFGGGGGGGGGGGNPSATGTTSDEVTLMCQDYSSCFSNQANFSGLMSPKTFNQSKQWWI